MISLMETTLEAPHFRVAKTQMQVLCEVYRLDSVPVKHECQTSTTAYGATGRRESTRVLALVQPQILLHDSQHFLCSNEFDRHTIGKMADHAGAHPPQRDGSAHSGPYG